MLCHKVQALSNLPFPFMCARAWVRDHVSSAWAPPADEILCLYLSLPETGIRVLVCRSVSKALVMYVIHLPLKVTIAAALAVKTGLMSCIVSLQLREKHTFQQSCIREFNCKTIFVTAFVGAPLHLSLSPPQVWNRSKIGGVFFTQDGCTERFSALHQAHSPVWFI